MKIDRFSKAIIISILIFISSHKATLHSAEIEGIFFNDEYPAGGRKLNIRGMAILNYMVVIKAYAGALYIENGTASAAVLGETPRMLELYYYHKISADDFRVSTMEMIKRNTSDTEFKNISERLNTFNRFYSDVKPGDRYRAEYIPGKGTTLYLNGKPAGTVPGNDFSRAFFSIWIGKDPIDRKFRNILLGSGR